ncbi:hypothetical protein BCR32DRAFT_289590 [Anaeromyces robustus]|uniref:Uncharacterized protein n=1 Tax=Anaeromyces robustus TaxID=1754192 RepID=A0A1Y1XMW0_9FUNG|nr:hypothetical protein BCR32DRAFT_289590 [Anaeromyces robustus]|eukprot:ORX87053.1 hypothetical protein BCR32DRAFT_289590 [Anaeromyces robustus]
MNSTEMRIQLYENLKRSGITDKMKSQLRSCIVQELLKNTKLSNNDNIHGYANIFENNISQKSFMTSKVLLKTINSLIIDYLKASNYEFTLSVFLPECGMSKNDEVYNEDDIKKVLNINKNHNKFNEISKTENTESEEEYVDKNPLLVKVLNNISKMCEVTYVEREIQTELSPLEQLDQNIGKINMEYDIAIKRQQEINKLTFEDRIIQYQKECEKRIRKEMEDEFERYKDIELGKLKLEEKRKQELLISEHKKKISDLDYEYTQKLREREIEERKSFLLKEQEFKHQLTKQQQKFSDEIERFLSKEDTLKREIEMNRRSQKLQEELIQKRLNDALKEIERLKAQDIDSNKIIEEAKLRYKQEFEQKFNNKLKELDMERKKLMYNQQELNSKMKKINIIENKNKEIKNEFDKLKNKYQNLIVECNYIKNKSNNMAIENKNLQIQLQSTNNTKTFEDEIKSLKNKLIESQNLNEKRQLEYQEIIKTMINQSQKDINKNKKQIQWKQECEELIQKLNNEINHSEELKKLLDDKTLRIKELERENADLTLLLHQTQTALQYSSSNKFSAYDNEMVNQKILYNEPLNNNNNNDLNDLKSSRSGSYNYITTINKLPDPWIGQAPSNNTNTLLNSSVLPPPFSFIDIDKKMKREMIMRQVQEKEEQNAKNEENYNNSTQYNYSNNIDLSNNSNNINNNYVNSNKIDDLINSQTLRSDDNIKNKTINNDDIQKINDQSNYVMNNTNKNFEDNESLKNISSFELNQNIKNKIDNNITNYKNSESEDNEKNDNSSNNKNDSNKNSSSIYKNSNNNLDISSNNFNNEETTPQIKESKIDTLLIPSRNSELIDIGKSISVCTLDIDSTDLEIDLNQTSIKIDDSKLDNTTHEPFETQYKLLAQEGEDHIKELENRILQGFESDDEIISIMSSNKENSSNKVKDNGNIKHEINNLSNNNNNNTAGYDDDEKDEETEKEKPQNKWIKNKNRINNSKNEYINDKTIKEINSNSDILNNNNNVKENQIGKNNDISSFLNLDNPINIDNLKDFETNNFSDNEDENKIDNEFHKSISNINNNENNENESNKSINNINLNENHIKISTLKSEDMVFNWEEEYDKSKIENAFKEINEKSNLDFSKLSLKTSSSTLSKKSLTESSIKTFSDNFGEGNTIDDEFSAPSVNADTTDSW